MAWLRRYISKPTLALITGVWNAISVYIPYRFDWTIETIAFVTTIGNLIIIWIATESGHEE